VEVNLIYEPEQEGAEDSFTVMEDTLEAGAYTRPLFGST